jgi:hypothetical protein
MSAPPPKSQGTARIKFLVLIALGLFALSGLRSVKVTLTYLNDGTESISTLAVRLQELEQALQDIKQSHVAKVGSQLPSCKDLMMMENSPFADGDFLTRVTTPHRWAMRTDGSRELDLTAICSLKRYSGQEARQCLAGKHLNLIGDSLTRYQYLSLAYFIHHGKYPPRFGLEEPCRHKDERGEPTCSSQPHLCMEGDWRDWRAHDYTNEWNWFFATLGGASDGGLFDGQMECSCARCSGPGCNPIKSYVENQLYVSAPDENGQRVTLTHFKEDGWGSQPNPIRGFNFTNCAYDGSCRRDEKTMSHFLARAMNVSFDYEEDLLEALNTNGILRSALPPADITVYNRGHWGILEPDRLSKILPLLYDFTATTNGRCFYRTTTGSSRTPEVRNYETTHAQQATFDAGCSFIDFAHLTDEFAMLRFGHPMPPFQAGGNISNMFERGFVFWDFVHFRPWVYEELNNMLLNILCN